MYSYDFQLVGVLELVRLLHLPLLSVLSCTSRIVDDVATYILSFGY